MLPPTVSDARETEPTPSHFPRTELIGICLMGAVGGILPTASKLAATYSTNPTTPLPDPAILLAIFIYALTGATICYVERPPNLRKSLILGIVAPGLLTNLIQGTTDPKINEYTRAQAISGIIVSSAFAADKRNINSELKKITIISRGDADNNLRSKEQIDVFVIDNEVFKKVGSIKNDGISTIEIPELSDTIVVRSDKAESEIKIPEGSFSVEVTTKTEPSMFNDFLWGLGADRYGYITDLTGTVVKENTF